MILCEISSTPDSTVPVWQKLCQIIGHNNLTNIWRFSHLGSIHPVPAFSRYTWTLFAQLICCGAANRRFWGWNNHNFVISSVSADCRWDVTFVVWSENCVICIACSLSHIKLSHVFMMIVTYTIHAKAGCNTEPKILKVTLLLKPLNSI